MVISVLENDLTVCVNCDWLQFSVELNEPSPELLCPDGYRIELFPGNNIYRNRCIVYDMDGRKWLTMLWCPHSSILNPRVAVVQFANWILYTGSIDDAWNVLIQIVDCTYNNMGRIDICCDFVASDFHLETVRHLNSGHYYVQGKHEGSTFWHSEADDATKSMYLHKYIHCLSWGSKSSEIRVKLYYKSREQGIAVDPAAMADKPWIVDEWRAAGFDISRVWRLEFSISGASCMRYHGRLLTLQDAANGGWLVDAFRELLNTRFIIRKNQGRRNGHKNLDAKVTFIDLQKSTRALHWQESREQVKASDAIVMMRRLLSVLDLSPCRCNDAVFYSVANNIIDLVHNNHLEQYFDKKVGGSVEAYLQTLYDKSGGGIVEVDNLIAQRIS